jgi:hypothetical protein
LTRIAEEAIAPYLDPGLPRRLARAQARWTGAAEEAVNAAVDEDAAAGVRERAEYVVDEYNHALANLRAARDNLDELQGELDDLAAEIEPPEPPEAPAPEIDEAAHRPLIDLEWDFVRATQALKARKTYVDEDDEP